MCACVCVCVRAEFNFKRALMLVVFAWTFDLQDVESPVHPGALQLCPRSCGGFFRVLAASEVVWSGMGEAILGIFNRLKPSRFIMFLFMIVFSQWEIQDLESEKQLLCIFLVSFLKLNPSSLGKAVPRQSNMASLVMRELYEGLQLETVWLEFPANHAWLPEGKGVYRQKWWVHQLQNGDRWMLYWPDLLE